MTDKGIGLEQAKALAGRLRPDFGLILLERKVHLSSCFDCLGPDFGLVVNSFEHWLCLHKSSLRLCTHVANFIIAQFRAQEVNFHRLGLNLRGQSQKLY